MVSLLVSMFFSSRHSTNSTDVLLRHKTDDDLFGFLRVSKIGQKTPNNETNVDLRMNAYKTP